MTSSCESIGAEAEISNDTKEIPNSASASMRNPTKINNTNGGTGPAVLVISGTSSGVGKTTVTVGLMAAFARRGYIVQPFKCGPDFLDGMHHEAAIRAGEHDWVTNNETTVSQDEGQMRMPQGHEVAAVQDLDPRIRNQIHPQSQSRRCVNLDGWMMGSTSALIQSFQRHSVGADICIIEGCMGLHDSANGTTDEASTAQIAKLLNAPVILVIDGSMMARSVAAMALGYGIFDDAMRLGAVVVNKVGGPVHIQWIKEALELAGAARLKDIGTGLPVHFAGALPRDTSASIPERHLGLTMPSESKNCSDSENESVDAQNLERFVQLATLVEDNLDLDALLRIGQTAGGLYPECENAKENRSRSTPKLQHLPKEQQKMASPQCRIGVAEDEAFCFYYRDNLYLLQLAGAELVPFSPLRSPQLPPALDGIYIGGGYPELHALKLEENESLRRDIASFSNAGGAIFAECGGLMYLAEKLLVSKDEPARDMCRVLPITIRMTPHMKMYYSEIEFTSNNPLFPTGGKCRGQKYHFSEVVEEFSGNAKDGDEYEVSSDASPLLVTPLLPGALPEDAGFTVNNTVASYFHVHFASYNDGLAGNKSSTQTTSFAEQFVHSAIATSPRRKAFAVSFVSAATEIIFALGLYAQSTLAGVTSVCDYPPEAQLAPRQIVCRSPIDAASMSSEQVDRAMKDLSLKREEFVELNGGKAPPGHWQLDMGALQIINPKIAFVQNTCDICDPCSDDVLYTLNSMELVENSSTIDTIQIAPTSLKEMFDCIEKIATVLEVPGRGEELIKSGLEILQRINTEVAKLNPPRPRVLSLEGLAPLCTGGHWLPDMKYAAGCVDALGDNGGCPARIITWADILSADPDILVISPCSASPTRTLNELHLLASTTEFWKLRSVQQGEVYIFDHGCFSRPGPRLVEGVEMMAALFRNIPPLVPSLLKYRKWSREALKYQCCTDGGDEDNTSVSHCTTELSSRFSPCFGGYENDRNSLDSSLPLTTKAGGCDLALCRVTRCTIPGSELPPNRSAHCLVPVKRRGSKMCSLLLYGGESQLAKRLNDTWELHAPANGWSALSRLDDKNNSILKIGTTPTWEKLVCGKVAGEDVPTHRSNHAMVACGDHIMVFGGWSVDNVTPLSDCELLHVETLCWTHCSTRGSSEPSSRGNPTLAYSK